ncbi:MAG: hypothetical protein PWP23_503 [Candidatus Sumerlaeota bacterium]|nr:hypothetical protein [Candidatus Sumerlaeota bacterium]
MNVQNKKRAILSGAVLLLGTAALIAQNRPTAEEEQAAKAIINSTVLDRNGVRTIVITYDSSSSATTTFAAAGEIDVTRLILANGNFSTGVGDPGGIQLRTSTNQDMLYIVTPGFGTQQLTFDPPLPLRAGDKLFFAPQTNNGVTAEWDLTLFGTNPATGKGDSVRVF